MRLNSLLGHFLFEFGSLDLILTSLSRSQLHSCVAHSQVEHSPDGPARFPFVVELLAVVVFSISSWAFVAALVAFSASLATSVISIPKIQNGRCVLVF